ncbi:MAG: SurA N-terminal domain-containing protein, partial [Giesbergeria sp.]|nr:SurA N-terminal domain-containing protein [Giesbergeria sp.]
MNHRVMTLALAASLACLASQGAAAQGLRPSSGTSKGLSQQPAAATATPTAKPAAKPALTLPTPSAADTGPRSADYIVAIVNSEPVTNYEVRSRIARVEQQLAQQGGNAPKPPRELIAREVLERIILEKAQLQLARETGIRVDDYAVNQAEAAVAQQNGLTVGELQRRLASEGLNRDRFREELRNQLLMQRVREREVDA